MKGIYADILLPLALEGLLTYRVPEELAGAAKRGQQVKVPVGKGIHTGVIFNVAEHTGAVVTKEIRDIAEIVNALPIVSENALVLWEWIARYYMCPREWCKTPFIILSEEGRIRIRGKGPCARTGQTVVCGRT